MVKEITFTCDLCSQQFESDELLYPHYLFEHGVFKQTCSTDVSIKQYEEQLELQSRYKLILSELHGIKRKLNKNKNNWEQIYLEKRFYFMGKEALLIFKRLKNLGAIVKEIPDKIKLNEDKLKIIDPRYCYNCNIGKHEGNGGKCTKEFSINMSKPERTRFICKCPCNKCQKCGKFMQVGHIKKEWVTRCNLCKLNNKIDCTHLGFHTLHERKTRGKWMPYCSNKILKKSD